MEKPIMPKNEVLMLQSPRALVRSASQPMNTVTTAATKGRDESANVQVLQLHLHSWVKSLPAYGGTDSRFALVLEIPG